MATLTLTFSKAPHEGAVYFIRNKLTKKYYVGSSCRPAQRWWTHRMMLNKGTHHSPALQRAWNKYGVGAFEFFVAGSYARDALHSEEQYWLDHASCAYNVSRRANRPQMTAEGRQRMAEKVRAHHSTPAYREAARQRALAQDQIHLRNRVVTDEQRAKLKQVHRDRCRRYEAFGRVWSLKELAEQYGVSYTRLKDRVRAGWDVERACTTKKRGSGDA